MKGELFVYFRDYCEKVLHNVKNKPEPQELEELGVGERKRG